jgi:hypothetical protein
MRFGTAFFGIFGGFFAVFGRFLGVLGRFFAVFGGFFGVFGRFLGVFGGFWGVFGGVFGARERDAEVREARTAGGCARALLLVVGALPEGFFGLGLG